MELERTLILLKPDAVARGLVGEVIARIERAGIAVIGAKMAW
ncbi:MAG: nucleoside-diphosphate kinase, partial [Mycobacteriales bacterium]